MVSVFHKSIHRVFFPDFWGLFLGPHLRLVLLLLSCAIAFSALWQGPGICPAIKEVIIFLDYCCPIFDAKSHYFLKRKFSEIPKIGNFFPLIWYSNLWLVFWCWFFSITKEKWSLICVLAIKYSLKFLIIIRNGFSLSFFSVFVWKFLVKISIRIRKNTIGKNKKQTNKKQKQQKTKQKQKQKKNAWN